ncbi:excinuclease ABC subunit A [Cellvibrio sp.]|uniref:excinuclease ABC subunit A n=1 Tax=Cellvibrio sp. TaxID=1965322 RepID=UPI0039648852
MKLVKWLSTIVLCTTVDAAMARDRVEDFSIQEVMASQDAKNILGDRVKFYFGDQSHPAVKREITETSYQRKTNGANKSDREACNWVFLTVMKELKEKAQSLGANAVVNIRSNYMNNPTSSQETFKCASGMLMSSVTLVGDIVVIEN